MRTAQLKTRELTLDRAQADKATRTVRASLSSEAPVLQMGVPEVLRHTTEAIDLSRAANGLPLLVGHDRQSLPIGVVENVRLESRRLVGDLRFGQSTRASEVWQDVLDGVLRSLSISYSVQDSEANPAGGYTAVRWTPCECSIVAIPADVSVGIGRSADPNQQGLAMSETQANRNDIAAERQRVAEITGLCRRHGVPAEKLDRYIADGTDIAVVRAAILDEIATRDEQVGPRRNLLPSAMYTTTDMTHQATRDAMCEALSARMGGPTLKTENQYRHAGVIDLARECLELRGVRTTAMSRAQIIDRALATSDLPELLTGAGQRTLRAAYGAYLGGLRRACKPSTAVDFRAKQRLALGEAPALLQVNEHGEYKYGAMIEAKESYRLATYGRIFGITRQALINDDLNGLGEMAMRLGRSAAEFEAQFLAALLVSNPTMAADGIALFHANHGNLATGAGSALSLTSLGTARKSMRLQRGLDGVTPIDATPRFLIVPAALETTAEQLVAQIQPTAAADVNVFSGKLEVVTDPRLDATSSTAWYLAADPAVVDGIEFSYLESAGGPEVFTQEGWEVDGLQWKVRLDYGAAALDHRGLYKAAGT